MFLCMKRKKAIPGFVTKGVDIHINKIVKEYSEGAKTITYEASVYSRDEDSLPIWPLAKPDNRHNYSFKNQEEVAQAISAYVNKIKHDYCLSEFEYKIRLHDRKETETKASITGEEAERITKSIENLLS